jgi:hypothetical protein
MFILFSTFPMAQSVNKTNKSDQYGQKLLISPDPYILKLHQSRTEGDTMNTKSKARIIFAIGIFGISTPSLPRIFACFFAMRLSAADACSSVSCHDGLRRMINTIGNHLPIVKPTFGARSICIFASAARLHQSRTESVVENISTFMNVTAS